jgi:1-deoxy-D-xylulose-5-phosphate synthase
MILASAKKTKKIVTIEDNVLTGGLGSAIMQLINKNELGDVCVKMFGYPDEFIQQGNVDELDNLYGMDYKAIACTILNTFTIGKKFKAL